MIYDRYSRPGMTYFGGFFILLGLVGAGLIVGSLVSGLIWTVMTHTSILSMEKEMLNPKYANAIKVLQVVSTFFIFFLPSFFTAVILSRKPIRFLGFNFYFSWRQLALVILIMLASIPLVGALAELNKIIPIPDSWTNLFQKLEDSYSQQIEIMARIESFGDYLVSLFIMALVPAIFEETLFRGGMQNILQRWSRNPLLAILITSVVFSAFHFSYYGFLSRLALGLILGLVYYYSQSLWLAIAGHFINNALVVTQVYYLTTKGKSIQEAMDETYPLWYGLVGLVLILVLVRLFKQVSKTDRRERTPPEDLALEENWIA